MNNSTQILSDITVFMKYARYIPELNRRETWKEIVDRNKQMHIERFPRIEKEINEVYNFVLDKKVLPSMRSLQFAGKPIRLNNSRLYNCCYMPMNHTDAFSELMFLLLGGCGVGFSVQKHHISILPPVYKPKKTRRYLAGDSIEGWADCVKVLIESYMGERKAKPNFDFSDIRAKGSPLKTAGGKAPGPEPLKTCLQRIETILERKDDGQKLLPIDVHDIACHIADAVLSGGIRRSAMISLFSFDDQDMLSCKYGNWYESNPQRGRANNSVVTLRHKVKRSDFDQLWEKIKFSGSGEPGIFFSNDQEYGLNPCGEISLKSNQFCNLVTINASNIIDQKDLEERCRAASFIATLQASYTDFHYLRDVWKITTEKDALIGVSMTGVATGRSLSLDLKKGAEIVKQTNEEISEKIGINIAARCTTIKPEGTTSLVLGCSSGIHAWHSKYYIRRVTVMKFESLFYYLLKNLNNLLETSISKPQQESFILIPQKSPESAITREESALDLLNRVYFVYNNWVKPGHRKGHNHNNVSATVTIKEHEWNDVKEWMWENKENYTALSVLPSDGHTYFQTPFEEISKEKYEEMIGFLKTIDLAQVKEYEDVTTAVDNLSCAGNVCELAL